ncbi:MAG TPA: hypothetical protein VFZ65_08805 [Planctomycetota bacterium]|nr:hypothetical protein [Planctomycetota bacterium]
MRLTSILFALLASSAATAQVIGIDDLDPTIGTANSFPWNVTGGQTSLHVYSAATLAAHGICPGAVLLDVEVAPSSGTAGTYNAPQAQLEIGHLSVSPPVPGNWATHLASPIIVHDLAAGPYTFPWTFGTWTSLPEFSTAGFVWDGVTDVGILYTSSAGVTGNFTARRTATQLRHYVAVFQATTQLPTSNGLFAMKLRMTWAPPSGCATNTVLGVGCIAPAPVTLAADTRPLLGSNWNLTVGSIPATTVFGLSIYGLSDPNIPDLFFLGMPTCQLRANLDVIDGPWFPAGTTHGYGLLLPSQTSLIGMDLFAQAATFELPPVNAFGAVTTNGIQGTLGNL